MNFKNPEKIESRCAYLKMQPVSRAQRVNWRRIAGDSQTFQSTKKHFVMIESTFDCTPTLVWTMRSEQILRS